MSNRRKDITNDTYGLRVIFGAGEGDIEWICRLAEKEGINLALDDIDSSCGRCWNYGMFGAIWLRRFDLGFLAHECVHCAVMGLDFVGIPVDANNHEAFAYYYQWIFDNLRK